MRCIQMELTGSFTSARFLSNSDIFEYLCPRVSSMSTGLAGQVHYLPVCASKGARRMRWKGKGSDDKRLLEAFQARDAYEARDDVYQTREGSRQEYVYQVTDPGRNLPNLRRVLHGGFFSRSFE